MRRITHTERGPEGPPEGAGTDELLDELQVQGRPAWVPSWVPWRVSQPLLRVRERCWRGRHMARAACQFLRSHDGGDELALVLYSLQCGVHDLRARLGDLWRATRRSLSGAPVADELLDDEHGVAVEDDDACPACQERRMLDLHMPWCAGERAMSLAVGRLYWSTANTSERDRELLAEEAAQDAGAPAELVPAIEQVLREQEGIRARAQYAYQTSPACAYNAGFPGQQLWAGTGLAATVPRQEHAATERPAARVDLSLHGRREAIALLEWRARLIEERTAAPLLGAMLCNELRLVANLLRPDEAAWKDALLHDGHGPMPDWVPVSTDDHERQELTEQLGETLGNVAQLVAEAASEDNKRARLMTLSAVCGGMATLCVLLKRALGLVVDFPPLRPSEER